jgi:orotate phosphoribosyltransferase
VVMDKSGIDEIEGVSIEHLFRTGVVDIKK